MHFAIHRMAGRRARKSLLVIGFMSVSQTPLSLFFKTWEIDYYCIFESKSPECIWGVTLEYSFLFNHSILEIKSFMKKVRNTLMSSSGSGGSPGGVFGLRVVCVSRCPSTSLVSLRRRSCLGFASILGFFSGSLLASTSADLRLLTFFGIASLGSTEI